MKRILEGKIKGAKETEPLSKTDLKLKVKCICKISGNKFGTGFCCKIKQEDKLIPVLMTNYHIIDDNFINLNKQLIIYIEDDMKIINLKNRKIYSSEDDKYDIMILKLKEEDEIYNFLEIDQNIFKNNSENFFRNEPVYILHFPNAKEASVSYGNGIEVANEYDIKHFCNTENCSSGGPIINLATDKIIGIHKGYIKGKYNIGTFLKFPLNDLNKNKYINEGKFRIQIIFQSDEFNQLDTNEFENKFKNEICYPELKNLKSILTDVIMGACNLNPKELDSRGNKYSCWGINKTRGNKPYYPPLGWIGIGLRVKGKYNNDSWIGNANNPGEWCVAYHGVGCWQSSDSVKDITGKICKYNFKPGPRQVHMYCDNIYNPGKKVGIGVYCMSNPKIAECYAGISEINGKKYKTVLMVRVKPDAIRSCHDAPDYWVVNGTTDEIRPYRILYKECE